jgi:hypothetical protein
LFSVASVLFASRSETTFPRKLGLRPAFFAQRIELRRHHAGSRELILQRGHARVRAGAAIADIAQFVDPFRRRGELVVPLVDREALLADLAEGLDRLLNREPIVDRRSSSCIGDHRS